MALKTIGVQPQEVYHIGDSLTNDVAGAKPLGIQTIWLNRKNKQLSGGIQPDHVCNSLLEIVDLL